MDVVNLATKLETFSGHWQPRTVAEFNGHDVMVVEAHGSFVWHRHEGRMTSSWCSAAGSGSR